MRKKIALLVGQPEESYQKAFIKGFLTRAFAENYDVCIFAMYLKHQATKGREQGESNIFSLVEPEQFEAVVVLANTIQTQGVLEHIEEDLHERYDKPVIFVDRESKYFHTVAADNTLPIKKLVSHLIEDHGYTDIAFLTGNEHHPHAVQRLQSFKECMHEHGLEIGENRVFYGDFWFNSGRATAEKLLRDRKHLPQAVACANDFMAMGLIEELRKEGVRVPEDVAVTGHDLSFIGMNLPVNITSMPIPAEEIGEHCLNYVKALSEGREFPPFSSAPDIFIGETCGCGEEKRTVIKKEETRGTKPPPIFEFNVGMMEDDIFMQTENLGVMNTILSYVNQIRPFEGFHICLNSGWADGQFGSEIGEGYTDIMVDALSCSGEGGGADRVDLTAVFDRKILLPELQEESAKPRAYYFTPLFFDKHCLGFAAVNYGESIQVFGGNYQHWLSAVMRGLECFMNISILRTKNAQLETAQIRDSLTGLYNYKGFSNYMASVMEDISGTNSYVETAVMELCGVNSIYMNAGSRSGDKIIVDFSDMMLTSRKNKREIFCYLGNNEFLAVRISQDENDKGLIVLLGDVCQKFEQYVQTNDLSGKIELTLGKAQGHAESEEAFGSLIGEAISRKNANKIREQRQEQSRMSEEEKKKAVLVADVLDNNKLIYFFQPIVSADTGDIFAYEALMRADVPERISPLDILKCAEYLGRLNDVEKATFFNVLSYVENNGEKFTNKKVFINSIPGTQVSEEDENTIREKMTDLSGKIVVELTEQAELGDEELEDLKKKYKRLGVETAVDDYGTGYSNVYNLLRYMPNVVKIDRMLLANINISAQKQHFVREIIEFSHNNGITVLAEGVETTEELKMVTAFGVDLIQGYYTAKPNAEVLQKIDRKVRSEIVQYRQYAQNKDRGKVFTAGQDGSISLIQLVTGHYSKIRFTPEDVPHRDVSIIGLQGFQANIEIDVEDDYTGRIELRDADLAVHNDHPTIKLGENCDVTLVLSGENVLEQGGIVVPESSKLTVQGDGSLRIPQISVNGCGIGNDKDSRCGELFFEQDGRIEIGGNTVHGVGIGAGTGGRIHINRGMYSITFAGEEAVGIGFLYADAELSLQYCAVDLNIRNSTSAGIGSVKGNSDVDIAYTTVKGVVSGGRCVGIGSVEGERSKLVLQDGTVDIQGRAAELCCIGSIDGEADISASKFSITVSAEGKEAVAMGNHKRTAHIGTSNGDLIVRVKNCLDYDIGAENFEMINGYSEFTLNDRKIVRESTAGEMQ